MRNQRGSIMLETVFACILLTMIFAGMTEVFLTVRDQISIIRIAREGAREAALSGSLSAGESRAREVASINLNKSPVIDIKAETLPTGVQNVICKVSYEHTPFIDILDLGGWTLNAEACYHFKDYSE